MKKSILEIDLKNLPSEFILRDYPLPNNASKKTPIFASQFLQNFRGYKGWRFICTVGEDSMRSSTKFVVAETILDIFKRKDTTHEYKGKVN